MHQSIDALRFLEELHREAARIHNTIGLVEDLLKAGSEAADQHRSRRLFDEFVKCDHQLARVFMASPTMSFLLLMSVSGAMEFVVVNEAFQRLSGYRSEEVIGRSPEDIDFWADHRDRDLVMNSFHKDGRISDLEYRFRRKDGVIRSGLMTADTVEIGGRMGMVVSAIDITERNRRAELALRKARQPSPPDVSFRPS